MSGGSLNYIHHKINSAIEDIETELKDNAERYDSEIFDEISSGVKILKLASMYAHSIEWLMSGDIGEETFLERIREGVLECGCTIYTPKIKLTTTFDEYPYWLLDDDVQRDRDVWE